MPEIAEFQISDFKFYQGKRARLGRGSARGRVERVNARLRGIRTAAQISALAKGNRVVGAIARVRGGHASQLAFFYMRLGLHVDSQLLE